MSLQVWLPLNGDLRNQGINNINVNNYNTVLSDSGKLGYCYNFNGTNSYISLDSVFQNKNQILSISFWIKFNSFPASSSYYCLFCSRTSTASTGIAAWLSSSKQILVDIGARWTTNALSINTNEWYHFIIISSTIGRELYINGTKIASSTIHTAPTTVNSNKITIGAQHSNAAGTVDGTYLNGFLNDFRIYNHCLSLKEIKELAKGLVLHMPFKDNGTVPYNKNLLPDSNVNALTKMLGTQARYYEQASVTGYTATWITIADPPAPGIVYGLQLEKTSGTAFHAVTWYLSGTISVSAEPYTMSAYVKRISGTDLQLAFEYGKSPYVGTRVTIINDDEWHQYSWTFTPNTASGQAAASGTTRIYCGGLSSEVGTIQICGWKLEKGSTATPWNECGNVFYDCSGFGNSGMGVGSLTKLTTAPRFGAGIKFDNAYKHIIIPNFPTTGFGDSYSFAWWGTRSAQNVMYWGFGNGIKLNGMYNGIYWNTGDGSENPLYKPGTTTAVTAPALNTWTHWVMTGDGEKCRVYQNGALWAEAKTYKSISGSLLFINGWNNLKNYSSNNLSIADFRIYATALSAEDVKELYESSAAIDNFANAYGREIIETDDTLSINKQGQFIVNDIEESNSITTAALTKVDKKLKTNTLYEY